MIFKSLVQEPKTIIDVAAGPTAVGLSQTLSTISDILSIVVLVLTAIWYGIRFYEWYKGKVNADPK